MRTRVGTRLIGAWILAASLSSPAAQAPKSLKTWNFTLPHGTLQIELKVSHDNTVAMYIGPDQQGREAPVAEQVEPLKKVLAEMPGLGLNPRNLTYIGRRIYGKDAFEKLAYACADSKEWRTSVKENNWRNKGDLIVSLLNRLGVYEPYNDVFKEYGIQARVTEAEIPGLTFLSEVAPRDSHGRRNGKIPVPAAIYIGMRFFPIDTAPVKSKGQAHNPHQDPELNKMKAPAPDAE